MTTEIEMHQKISAFVFVEVWFTIQIYCSEPWRYEINKNRMLTLVRRLVCSKSKSFFCFPVKCLPAPSLHYPPWILHSVRKRIYTILRKQMNFKTLQKWAKWCHMTKFSIFSISSKTMRLSWVIISWNRICNLYEEFLYSQQCSAVEKMN